MRISAQFAVADRPDHLKIVRLGHVQVQEQEIKIRGARHRQSFSAVGHEPQDSQAGEVGYVQKTLLHYIENTGETDLVFLEMFKSSYYQDLSFAQWLTHTLPELVVAHLHIDKSTFAAMQNTDSVLMPL